jgi:hypothetical protein
MLGFVTMEGQATAIAAYRKQIVLKYLLFTMHTLLQGVTKTRDWTGTGRTILKHGTGPSRKND